ncbi:MAG: glycosyltransferase [Polaromonas sp.]|nr:glycosyltransferase [Polaromonas sp.]
MLKRLVESHHRNPNYRHTVISLTGIGTVGRQLQAIGCEVHALGMRSVLDIPHVMLQLVRLIRTCRPDVVQTWMYHADLLGGLAARIAGCNSVIWGIHSINLAGSGARSTVWVRSLCAILSRWVPKIIVCVAEASRTRHIALGYRADRMIVIPNGFNLANLQASESDVVALRAACGFTTNDVVVGSLGRFNYDKDQHNFVCAAGLLGLQYPQLRFLMVGRNCDANNQELMDWIATTGFAERFVVIGERSDAPVCLAAMDIFCLSSRSEAFPLVVGEAMALRRPCVITNVGDATYLLGDCGVVVPKEDHEALAAGVVQLLKLPASERAVLGKRAQARIAAEFSMDQARERFELIYQKISRKERT